MVIIGVTGGLGSGKTTACGFLKEKGAYIFDADSVAKEILQTEQSLQEEITEAFGMGVVKDGKVDFLRLAKVGFMNEESQTILNDLVHPYVIDAFERKVEEMKGKIDLFVFDAPLIFESGLDSRLDHTVLIYTKLKHRLERTIRKGKLPRDEILRRIDLQMPEEEKRELATHVIDNNGSVEQLKEETNKFYYEIMG